MFCPRCGRAVNANANFCGGCGLSKVEIEKYIQQTQPVPEAPKADEVKTEVPFGTVVNEPVKTEPAVQPAAETVSEAAAQTFSETAETVIDIEPEECVQAPQSAQEVPVDKEVPKTAPAAETAAFTGEAPKTEPQHNYAENTQQYNTQSDQYSPQYPYGYQAPVKSESLSTVDFIWMMVISSLPLIGLIYLIYLAIQNDNTNKRSYARASLIISIFASIIGMVFVLGFLLSAI